MQYNIHGYETEKKVNIVKVVIAVLIVLAIVVGIISAIYFNKKKNEKPAETAQTEVVEENKVDVNLVEVMHDTRKKVIARIPRMTPENIQKIKDIYKQGDSEHKRAYLTFDDGPSNTITPQILDILKEYDIKATFFVLGTNVENYPELIQREYNEGHYIANHGYTHQYAKIYAAPENVLNEYNQTEEKIRAALGKDDYKSGLFRFPGGSHGGTYADIKHEAAEILEENNVAYLDWNALTSDAVPGTDRDQMVRDLKDTVAGNDCVVILMHDAANKQDTADLLPQIIEYLKEEGYEFKNIYDIMYDNI